MANPAEIAKDLLVAAGVGTFGSQSGWGIFVSKEPTSPDTTVTVYNTGGLAPNPKWLLDFPSIQVRVRGAANGFVAARQKAQDAKDALLGIPSQDVGPDRLVAINGISDVADIGYDEKERPLFTVNFSLIIEPGNVPGDNRIPLTG